VFGAKHSNRILDFVTNYSSFNFQILKDRELAKVAIKKSDVELIMRELEVTKQIAERSLREHQGCLQPTLVALTN